MRHLKKKKRKTFILIEVLISIAIVSLTCYAAFHVLTGIAQKNRSEINEQEGLIIAQKSVCKLIEALYANKIMWNTIADSKKYLLPLDSDDFEAFAEFEKVTRLGDDSKIPESFLEVNVKLKVHRVNDNSELLSESFEICLQKE